MSLGSGWKDDAIQYRTATYLLLDDIKGLKSLYRHEIIAESIREVQRTALEVDDVDGGGCYRERGQVHFIFAVS